MYCEIYHHCRPVIQLEVFGMYGTLLMCCSLTWVSWIHTRRESTLTDWMTLTSFICHDKLMMRTNYHVSLTKYDIWYSNGEMISVMLSLVLSWRAAVWSENFLSNWFDWLSMVLRLRQHNIGYTADGFYRSDDPTNSVKALKEGG